MNPAAESVMQPRSTAPGERDAGAPPKCNGSRYTQGANDLQVATLAFMFHSTRHLTGAFADAERSPRCSNVPRASVERRCPIARYDLANLTSAGINGRLADVIVNACQLLHNASSYTLSCKR